MTAGVEMTDGGNVPEHVRRVGVNVSADKFKATLGASRMWAVGVASAISMKNVGAVKLTSSTLNSCRAIASKT